MFKVNEKHIGERIFSYEELEKLAKQHKCVYILSWNQYKCASYIIHMQACQVYNMLKQGLYKYL